MKAPSQQAVTFNLQVFFCLQGGSRDETMCHTMYCYIPTLETCSFTVEIRAQEGTSCGNGKWCRKGLCQLDPQAPQTQGNLQGSLLN